MIGSGDLWKSSCKSAASEKRNEDISFVLLLLVIFRLLPFSMLIFIFMFMFMFIFVLLLFSSSIVSISRLICFNSKDEFVPLRNEVFACSYCSCCGFLTRLPILTTEF